MAATTNWREIRSKYINQNISLRKLAEEVGVSYSQIAKVAAAEKWTESRENQRIEIESETNKKAQEKISDTLAEEAAVKARIRLKLIKMAEDWVDKQDGTVNDPADYRRIVQSCMDMGVFNPDAVNAGETREDDPLTVSLMEEAERLENADIE